MSETELWELEVEVAVKVMGWPVYTLEQALHDGNTPRPHCLLTLVPDGTKALRVFDTNGNLYWWRPARDIAAAWLVVEKLRERFRVEVDMPGGKRSEGDGVEVMLWSDFWEQDHPDHIGMADTAPLAICKAALAAAEARP